MNEPMDLTELIGDLRTERPPLYTALATRLQLLIGDGRIPVGARLPAERDLAASIHLSRATVASAYARLREDGWAEARQGAGTWTRVPSGSGFAAWLPEPPRAGIIDMAQAAPAAPAQLSSAYRAAMDDMPHFLPGHGYFPAGWPELRERIAARYSARGLPTTAEQIVVTNGALHALSLALEVLGEPGERVVVEAPTYPNALDLIAKQRLTPVPVAVDVARPDVVPRAVQAAARSTRASTAYLMPDFQNPTGLLLGDDLRSRLAATLADAGTTAIIDETLADLGFGASMPAPFASYGRADSVVTLGSMSKSFWGGLRIGWIRAEESLARAMMNAGAARHLALPVFEQLVASHLLDHADDVLVDRREQLRGQRDALMATIGHHLPGWRAVPPDGGVVLWCALPDGLSSSFLAGGGSGHGLRLSAGPRFGTGYAFDDRIRLPFTHPVDVLEEAVRRIAGMSTDAVGPRDTEPEILV